MPSLPDELKTNADAILNELVARAKDELKGTLYEEMSRQRILRARYANVLEVLTQYLIDHDDVLFRQHHIIIFMQRYYLDIDHDNALNARLINWRAQEIQRSVALYREVLREYTQPADQTTLDTTFAQVAELIQQMRQYLLDNVDRFAAIIPRVKMVGIDYAPESTFDIDPQHWP
jgi:hypothetical protein